MDGQRLAPDAEAARHRVNLMIDRIGTIVTVDAKFGRMKLSRPLTMGDTIRDHIHPDDWDAFVLICDWVSAVAKRSITIRTRLSRGPEWWLPTNLTVQSEDDELLRIGIEVDDAAAARMAEMQMRQLVEGSLQGIVVRNSEKTFYINNSFAKLVGFNSVKEMFAEGYSGTTSAIHPDDESLVQERVEARLAGRERVSQYEFRLVRRDGTFVWVEAMATLVRWDGQPASLSWLIDISARKRVEADLIQSKEAAVYANKSKSEFLASMSHELRTPLNAILGFSEIIRDQMFGPVGATKYIDYAADIHSSGQHLLEIINDVLDLSKLEAGKLELHEGHVDVGRVIEHCLSLVRHRAENAGVTLTVDVPFGLPNVRADERALKQVMINFLSNAIKFTQPGGSVTASATIAGNKELHVSVSDTGIGMTPAELKVAMLPYGQVDSKVARKHSGTGLGLPISLSLMQLHGGGIVVASAPERGTKCTARFPSERLVSAAA